MDPLSLVRKWVAPYVGESGKNESDSDVLDSINEARRIIYPVGDWKDTVAPLLLQSHCGQITLPYWAENIRGAWQGIRKVEIDSTWYHPLGEGWHSWHGADCRDGMIDLGDRFASFKSAIRPFRIKVIPQDDRDKGVVLTFHAISEYGEPLLLTRTMREAWVPVTADPANDKWIKSFSFCEKPKTHDRIQVYIYDPVRGIDTLCAVYEADEVNPRYRRYRIDARRCGHQVVAKVKKKYRELTDDRELVDIHADALIHLLQGVTARKNRDAQGYATQVQAAKTFLDKEIQSERAVQTHSLRMSSVYRDDNLGFGEEESCFPY